jgi:hypothetical protein
VSKKSKVGWDRVQRYENEVILSVIEDTIARTLFSTELGVLGLYGKSIGINLFLVRNTFNILTRDLTRGTAPFLAVRVFFPGQYRSVSEDEHLAARPDERAINRGLE